ncbi:MAG: hypothetical protein WBB36_07345, partial [Chitinophagales bacterium]
MKNTLLIISIFFLNPACTSHVTQQSTEKNTLNIDSMKMVLMETDIAFSDLSLQKGTHEAFINYVADKGVLLRPNHLPIIGKDSVHSYLFAKPDTAFVLT